MASYDIRSLQLRILRIFLVFDQVCKEHGLRYSVTGGTELGAVRHKGFIPWDDDLDCGMPRPDYELFREHANKWLPEPYEFVCPENYPDYPLSFGKIQDKSTTLIERKHLYYLGGIYVDIFQLDGAPSCKVMQFLHFFKYEFLKQSLYLAYRDPYKHGYGPSCWAPLMAKHILGRKWIQRNIRKTLTAYDFEKSKNVAYHTDGLGGIRSKPFFADYADYEFEGHQIKGIKGYDVYLKYMYGDDYMTPPPEGKREQHNFDYLDLEHPFKDFKK